VQGRGLLADLLFHGRQVVHQDDRRGADAEGVTAFDLLFEPGQVAEETLNALEQNLPLFSQPEWTPVVQLDTQRVLQVINLLAQGGLLFVQRPGGLADTFVNDHVIEKLQLVNVHAIYFFYTCIPVTSSQKALIVKAAAKDNMNASLNQTASATGQVKCEPPALNILLIVPAGENVRVTPQQPQVPRRAMLRFSVLPLTIVAALTPPPHKVRIVDENVEAIDFDAPCDLVGVTFMTALAPRAYEIAEQFRRRGKLVVGGGYHATLCSQEAREHFDALVLGDAEGAWEQLLADVQSGNLQPIYRSPGGPLKVPAPKRELLADTARHYATVNAVQAGRGCRHTCRYCSVTVFHNHKYRRRSVSEIVEELGSVEGNFIFVDDNIIADRAFALELFRALVPLRKQWVSQCSILIADDPELLDAARRAGCCGLFIGIETASQANLAAMNKQFNTSVSYAERLSRIRSAGIGVIAGIIVGMDSDTQTVFHETLRFLQESRIDAVQVNILTPLPGTPLYQEMEQAGRIRERNWSHYDYRHVVFQPQQMEAEELQAGADWLIAEFYRLDRILSRFVGAIFTLGWKPALLSLKLGLTYRYDVKRGGISGWNPGAAKAGGPRLVPVPLPVQAC
jgi:radical SAM superfamily enzyme YgiQ (UPF0313 family)